MTGTEESISVVMPTFNRLPALRENFDSIRQLAGVAEIVVVVDGSTDGTLPWLEGLGDPRINLISQQQSGSPAARNAGIATARGRWLLMAEDDCYLPNDFALKLLEAANEHDAQIVSAPWLPVPGRDQMAAAFERGRQRARQRIHLETLPTRFPQADLETPFLNGIVLIRRDVFDVVRYDVSLRGNAWREETSMFLTAVDAGFKCVLTPRTASFQLGQWSGGQRRPRLAYEAWAIRNNWRFLRQHQHTLQNLGEIRDPVSAQTAFVMRRTAETASGYLRARWRGLRLKLRRAGETAKPS